MFDFKDFRNDVLNELSFRSIEFENVDFVNLGASQWTTIDVFAQMKTFPIDIQCSDYGSWSGVPIGFKVVLVDKRWLSYKQCPNPQYRKWELLSLPKRARKYVANE